MAATPGSVPPAPDDAGAVLDKQFKHMKVLFDHVGDLKPQPAGEVEAARVARGTQAKVAVGTAFKTQVDGKLDAFTGAADWDAKLKAMANVTNPADGGAPGLVAPAAHDQYDAKLAEFTTTMGPPGLVDDAKTQLAAINAAVKVETTKLAAGNELDAKAWMAAFDGPAQAFERKVDRKISALTTLRAAYNAAPPTIPNPGVTEEEKEKIDELLEKQIASLTKLKTEFKAQVDQQKNVTIPAAIKDATYPGTQPRGAPVVAGIRMGGALPDNTTEMNLEEVARFMRAKQLGFELLRLESRRSIRSDKFENIESKEAKTGDVLRVAEGDKSSMEFKLTDEGITFERTRHPWRWGGDASYVKDFGAVLDAFYVLKGKSEGTLTLGKNTSFSDVEKMAEAIAARRLEEPPRPPIIKLSDSSILKLIKEKAGENPTPEAKEAARVQIATLDAKLRGKALPAEIAAHVAQFKIPSSSSPGQEAEQAAAAGARRRT